MYFPVSFKLYYMTLLRKSVITGILTIVVIIVGFIFLLKGCLAKYDERSVKTPALVFEKDRKAIIFSIVEFQKATSYSRKGNFVRKSVNTNYYIQTNDGETAALIHSKKIKNHRDIRQYPVEILGASGTTAWLFMGEPMAFDAITLNKTADSKILEEKNPALLGKLPVERQFYSFNNTDNNIYFTAKDGTKWQLNTQTLLITSSSYQKNQSAIAQKLDVLQQQEKLIQANLDTLYQQKSLGLSKDYADKKISYPEYRQLNNNYYIERDQLNSVLDSFRVQLRKWEKDKRKMEETERTIENLQRTNLSFSQTKQNQDTVAGQWFGIYSDEELEKLYDRVSDQAAHDETIRRKLFAGSFSISKNEDAIINKAAAKSSSTVDFLAAGFLVNKKTGRPVRLPGNQSFLIVHKEQVGREGKILITNVTADGKASWTYNTQLADWADWVYTGKSLYIFGVNNKSLGSNESNILICLNLENGKASMFDYFTNKLVKD
jgi:hypothetical protein